MTAHSPRRRAAAVSIAVGVILLCALALPRLYRWFMQALYPTDYAEYVLAAAEDFDLPPSLLYAVIHTESHFQADAVSHADAKGLMQLTDDTFLWALERAGDKGKYTTQELFEPSVNIHYGAYVLSLFREQFEETATALAAYNAGQGRVAEWLKDPTYSADGRRLAHIPYKETREYVQKVQTAQTRYQQLYDIP